MRSLRQLAIEVVGLSRARAIGGAFVLSSDECAREVHTLMADWVLVPKRPTQAMIEAHQGCCAGDADEAGPERIKECWHEMVCAVSETEGQK